jgi:hypothetical protein
VASTVSLLASGASLDVAVGKYRGTPPPVMHVHFAGMPRRLAMTPSASEHLSSVV